MTNNRPNTAVCQSGTPPFRLTTTCTLGGIAAPISTPFLMLPVRVLHRKAMFLRDDNQVVMECTNGCRAVLIVYCGIAAPACIFGRGVVFLYRR